MRQSRRRRIFIIISLAIVGFALFFVLPFSPGKLFFVEATTDEPSNFYDFRSENITRDSFNQNTKNFVFVTSTWCGSCDYYQNEVKTFAQNFPNLNFYIVDIDKSRKLTNELGIILPETLVFLDDGGYKVSEDLDLVRINTQLNVFEEIGSYAL